jgi:hypothetical protein
MERYMPEYRAYMFGDDGHFFEAVPLVCADDAEAMEKARRLVDGHDVELWERDRKVAKFDAKRSGAVTHEVHDGRMIPKPAK